MVRVVGLYPIGRGFKSYLVNQVVRTIASTGWFFFILGDNMKEYIKRFNTSYEEARKLKEEIYSMPLSEKRKDDMWERITECCLRSKEATWYFEKKIVK